MRIADAESKAFFEQAWNIAANNNGTAIIDFENGCYLTLIATEDA